MHDIHDQHQEMVEVEYLEFRGRGILGIIRSGQKVPKGTTRQYHNRYKGLRVEQSSYCNTINRFALLVYKVPRLPNLIHGIHTKRVDAELRITKKASIVKLCLRD